MHTIWGLRTPMTNSLTQYVEGESKQSNQLKMGMCTRA